MNPRIASPLAIACALVAAPAAAYIGPGAGLSLVGALWAVIVAVGAALFFILAWPLRRMLRRRRAAAEDQTLAAAADAEPAPPRSDQPH